MCCTRMEMCHQSRMQRRLRGDFDLADGDIDMPRLIAMSCLNVRAIDQDHYLGLWRGPGSSGRSSTGI